MSDRTMEALPAPEILSDLRGLLLATPIRNKCTLQAYLASSWLAGVSETRLRGAIPTLLLILGALFIAEAALVWHSPGLPLNLAGRLLVGVVAGGAIGMVSSLLGVAGGELIIPTLVFGFGIGVKEAGTTSLLGQPSHDSGRPLPPAQPRAGLASIDLQVHCWSALQVSERCRERLRLRGSARPPEIRRGAADHQGSRFPSLALFAIEVLQGHTKPDE
jgi:hypothetical protein